MPPAASNPFATRHTRPGALPYLLPPGVSADDLVERLRQASWRGEIIGPHGTGKSTLLASLVPQLAAAGREVRQVTLTAGEATLPLSDADAATWTERTLLVVDGYEQLSWPSRLWLTSSLASRGAGVLVTAHEPMGFPSIWTTTVDADLAWQIVGQLLPAPHPRVTRELVAELLAEQGGNFREVLFALYDVVQGTRK